MVLDQNPPVSWADLFYLTDSVLILAALLSFPLARRTRLERWKFVLDAAMVLVGGAVVIWYFSIRPTAGATENSSLVITLLAFAYPLISMLVLLGHHHRDPAPPDRRQPDGVRPARGRGVHQRRGRPDVQPDLAGDRAAGARASIDGAYLLCYIMLIAGAELYYRRPVPQAAKGARRGSGRSRVSPLPYLAVATTYGLLLYGGAPAVDRSGQRARRRRAAGDAVRGGRGSSSRCGRTSASWRDQAVRQNEARFRSLVQHSSDVIIVTRANGSDAVREPVGQPGVRLRPVRDGGPADLDPAPPRRPGARHHAVRGRRADAGRHRTGRVAVPPARRLVAQRRDPGDQPHGRPQRARHRAQHPRRQRAEAPGGAAHPPGLPRPAHRPRQPRAVPRPRESRAGAGAAAVESDHGALPGPGRLQAGERQPGPCRGRPPADLGGRALPLLRPRGRHRGPAGRRRVRHPAGALGRPRGPERAARAPRDRDEPSVHAEREPGAGDRQHRRRHRGRRRERRRPAPQRRRRDVRRQAPGQGPLGDVRVADVRRRPRTGSRWRPRSAPPSTAASSRCTTSRSCTSRPAPCTASRRWCAGSTRPTAISCRSTSSRWRRRPGSSCSSGAWVLDEACRQVQAWRLAYPQNPLSMSVNISGRQLQGPGIADALQRRARQRRAWIRPR